MERYSVFKVRVALPTNVSPELMRQYIEDAVTSWWGQFEPGSELWRIGDRIKPVTIGAAS